MRFLNLVITSILFTSVLVAAGPLSFAKDKDVVEEPSESSFSYEEFAEYFNDGFHRYLQVATSRSSAQFNALIPKELNLKFRAVEVDSVGQPTGNTLAIAALPIGGEISDPNDLLLEKVIKFKFVGLKPGARYRLETWKASRGSYSIQEDQTRYFRTVDPNKTEVTWANGSCGCDERQYEGVRKKIWLSMVKNNPDFIALLGDQVYVDSKDYARRGEATPLQIWQRFFRAFTETPITRAVDMVPVFAIPDDHENLNDSVANSPFMSASAKAHDALFGGVDIPMAFDRGTKRGNDFRVRWNGQNFHFLDNRRYRRAAKSGGRYDHFGREQEDWLIENITQLDGPNFILTGGMWAQDTVYVGDRPITESFYGDHPVQFNELTKRLIATGKAFVPVGGDIHAWELVELGPMMKGSHYLPFHSVAIVNSPLHSFIFKGSPLWKNEYRIAGDKSYNFGLIQSSATGPGLNEDGSGDELELFYSVNSLDANGGNEAQVKTVFKYGTHVGRSPTFRRGWLNGIESILSAVQKAGVNKVSIAGYDADSTLRTAISGNVSANSSTDVFILPNVAKGIHERQLKARAEGRVEINVILSNQGGAGTFVTRGDADLALLNTATLVGATPGYPLAEFKWIDWAGFSGANRKGKGTEMFDRIVRELARYGVEVDMENSIYVGDSAYKSSESDPTLGGKSGDAFSNSDRLFAEAAGLKFIHPQDVFGWSDEMRAIIMSKDPAMRVPNARVEAIYKQLEKEAEAGQPGAQECFELIARAYNSKSGAKK